MIDFIKRSWFSLIMLALGILFIVGYFGIWRDQAAGCTLPVTATVTHSEEVTVATEDGTRYEYRITAEYEAGDETHLYQNTVSMRLDAGDSYKLVYNPDDPAEAMTPGRAKMIWLAPVVGLAMIAYFLWPVGWIPMQSSGKSKR